VLLIQLFDYIYHLSFQLVQHKILNVKILQE
jgi:hypothetical protein